ncbi:hypothetical protein QBC42DRAFT_28571 [Cladorrhinum samala]|uniref:Uncharacterized protein n=1 Tax=Cladorrhinum samala TaxID=585594 RepID=A0AAV9HF34_9PEZI|nr:hypothetical protein QBC42DRAFT_28571 [Cladorrhinum samala]
MVFGFVHYGQLSILVSYWGLALLSFFFFFFFWSPGRFSKLEEREWEESTTTFELSHGVYYYYSSSSSVGLAEYTAVTCVISTLSWLPLARIRS